jgi:predicted membrane chloride channel (bestrophin family)
LFCVLQSWNHIGLIPISAIISFFFFGIEELAVALEEPFSILPLQNMTDGMGLSAKEYADWHFEKDIMSEGRNKKDEEKEASYSLKQMLSEFQKR